MIRRSLMVLVVAREEYCPRLASVLDFLDFQRLFSDFPEYFSN